MKHKSFLALLLAVSSSIALSACDLASLLNGGANKKSENEAGDNSEQIEPNGLILSFKADRSGYATYFRSTSLGDFDYSKKTYKEPDFYDSNLISDGSVHPLCYLGYKIKKLDELGMLPDGFGMTNYEITYNQELKYYPTPECQVQNDENALTNSDAHYIKAPANNKYSCKASYVPAYNRIIDVLNAVPFSGAVNRDEKAYYQYTLAHYTNVPNEYLNVIDDMIHDNDWYEGEYGQVDSIAAYVSGLGQCSLFNDDGAVDVSTSSKNSDPVFGLIENRKGTDFDFNTVAVMVCRRLYIPARMVEGYVTADNNINSETEVTQLNHHYWCEIYVKGTGWMILDCMDMSSITGTNPYEGLDQSNTPLENKHILDRIVVNAPTKTEYYIGEELDLTGGYITAYFSDGTTSRMNFTAAGISVTGFDSETVGSKIVTVSYTYEGVTKVDTFNVEVIENS